MERVYDVIIIGSGPGGLTAAIYSGRYARKTLVIGGLPGGIAGKAGVIENWPGTKSIQGLELMMNFRTHAEEYGVDFVDKYVTEIKKENNYFIIELENGEKEVIKGKTIIFSLGTKTRTLNIPGEEKLSGRGVSYCATCDGMFFKNREVVIVGGADSACKAAVYLADIAKKVTIIYRGDKLRGEPVYLRKINENKNAKIIYNTVLLEIKGENKVESLLLKDKQGKVSELKTDGVFIEIGADPKNRIAEKLGVNLDDLGYVIVGRDMKTNIKGVYAVGDMTNTPLRQIITAAGDGAMAAHAAHEYIQKLE